MTQYFIYREGNYARAEVTLFKTDGEFLERVVTGSLFEIQNIKAVLEEAQREVDKAHEQNVSDS